MHGAWEGPIYGKCTDANTCDDKKHLPVVSYENLARVRRNFLWTKKCFPAFHVQNKVCSRATPKVTYEKKKTSHAWQQESKHLIRMHSAWSNPGPLVYKSTLHITSDTLTSVHHVSISWNTIPYNHDNVAMWCNAIRCDTMCTSPFRWHFPGILDVHRFGWASNTATRLKRIRMTTKKRPGCSWLCYWPRTPRAWLGRESTLKLLTKPNKTIWQ